MRQADDIIIGGGLAGACAAAMLGRGPLSVVMVDPHEVYPPDFRCEKLDALQVRLLRKTGLAEPVLAASTPDKEVWIVRYGRLIEKRRNGQHDILYDTLVNTVRGEIPSHVTRIAGKAENIVPSPDRQEVTLGDGTMLSGRLVILATGLNNVLRQSLGIEREILSPNHSISIGFDLAPADRSHFEFRALTYYPGQTADRMAYMTLFPIGTTLRANLFVYREPRDPWLQLLRDRPEQALRQLMPEFESVAGAFKVTSEIKIRPVDLMAVRNYRRSGVVLVGDAFGTSCPAAGTGVNKVFTDVERLCDVHIPRWFASPGMGEDKIGRFYDDPVKQACDEQSRAKAYFLRSLSTNSAISWRTRRLSRFMGHLGVAALRQARERLGVAGDDIPIAESA
jgi:2-polyprenyl-6-methoxyphenol hydroxylase-like FAD-dependent oxidoreductase